MGQQADIGIVGLGLMGRNLALNIERNRFSVAGYDIDESKRSSFVRDTSGKRISTSSSLAEFVGSLKSPKRILMMVPAGKAVDALIGDLKPHLTAGDILIDGGNTHFTDTERRMKSLEPNGILYIGTGVSGGEEGALLGPSIMPGGSPKAWPAVKPILQAIAAKLPDGSPCCEWVGVGGAGHYVKMVHNGIEYGDMQLICEAYQIMHDLLGMGADEMHEVFKQWNEGDLNSYLIEITRDILAYKDSDGKPLVDKILDTAGQKGTGKWASVSSLDLGIPLTLISEAVYARCLSAIKDERVVASKSLRGPGAKFSGDRKAFVSDLEKALYASKIVSYAQGFSLLRAAADEFHWELDYGGISRLWRAGCIIRSVFLGKIKEAFDKDARLANLLLDPFFKGKIESSQESWRRVIATAVTHGVWAPASSAALAYYDGYRNARLPANLLQAQRDYFGAHQYERVDKPRGEFFHTNWTGRGGDTASSVYTA
jgi:6-phosphogluconate dehydrogenase